MQVSWTWTDKLKSEDKEYTVVLKKNSSMFWTALNCFFPRLVASLKSGSSYRG